MIQGSSSQRADEFEAVGFEHGKPLRMERVSTVAQAQALVEEWKAEGLEASWASREDGERLSSKFSSPPSPVEEGEAGWPLRSSAQEKARATQIAGVPVSSPRFCSCCGARLAGRRFCETCGTEVQALGLHETGIATLGDPAAGAQREALAPRQLHDPVGFDAMLQGAEEAFEVGRNEEGFEKLWAAREEARLASDAERLRRLRAFAVATRKRLPSKERRPADVLISYLPHEPFGERHKVVFGILITIVLAVIGGLAVYHYVTQHSSAWQHGYTCVSQVAAGPDAANAGYDPSQAPQFAYNFCMNIANDQNSLQRGSVSLDDYRAGAAAARSAAKGSP